MTEELKGKCFNEKRIDDLKDKWQQFNMEWDSYKNNIPEEIYEILEEIIFRLDERNKNEE